MTARERVLAALRHEQPERYILAPAHLFQPDVPPENVLAVYQD